MSRVFGVALVAIVVLALPIGVEAQSGDPARGEQAFRACAACHSLVPDKNMTGPSLAELWGRKAGALPSFRRYSPALKKSGLVWDDATLDAWLQDPQHLIPGNVMTFPGVKDAGHRADLLAYLKGATQKGHTPTQAQADRGGMMGMMGGGEVPNLKKVAPGEQVRSIHYCADTYTVTTGDGKTRAFWERNLRFKTDSSADGPEKGAPAMVGAGMMGDRASVIFAAPEEIGSFIARCC